MDRERTEVVADHASDEQIRAKRLQDPEVQARVREIQERLRRGEPPGPGISAEALQDFLREHG